MLMTCGSTITTRICSPQTKHRMAPHNSTRSGNLTPRGERVCKTLGIAAGGRSVAGAQHLCGLHDLPGISGPQSMRIGTDIALQYTQPEEVDYALRGTFTYAFRYRVGERQWAMERLADRYPRMVSKLDAARQSL